jgi:hypothetical protein
MKGKGDHWLAISCLKCVGTGRKDYNTIYDCPRCNGHGTVPCAWWIEMQGAECEREDQAEPFGSGGSPAFRWLHGGSAYAPDEDTRLTRECGA